MKQLLAIKNGYFSFSQKQIFTDVNFQIYEGDKICLIGKNGTGKSSLMRIISEDYNLDSGEIVLRSGTTIGYLKQDSDLRPDVSSYDFIFDNIGKEDIEDRKYEADIFLDELNIDGNMSVKNLSGGNIKRLNIIKELIKKPDIILLDEPTNHLDIEAIEWLEKYINTNNLTLVCVSHDREFLNNISNKIYLIDNNAIYMCNKGFKYFDEFIEELVVSEQKKIEKMNRKLNAENHWLKYGVTARRKRNQNRLRKLHELKDKLQKEKQKFKVRTDSLKLPDLEVSQQNKLVLELDDITIGYPKNDRYKIIFKNCSMRIMKEEKIGIVGKNGIGKSTFLNVITKKSEPISGRVKYGPNIEISYADQNRTTLDTEKSLIDNICEGNNVNVKLGDITMHVAGYLKKFLFPKERLNDLVSTLSGGEKNRLLLAKIMLRPGNLLILDEPTNDLDMESMEMLEEVIMNYSGTVIIVSHDRAFLDDIVTRTLVIDEKGISDYIGGYTEYKNQNKSEGSEEKTKKSNTTSKKENLNISNKQNTKLSYKDQRDLEILPAQIANIELEISEAEYKLSDINLFSVDNKLFNQLMKSIEIKKKELSLLEERWFEVMQMEEEFKNKNE